MIVLDIPKIFKSGLTLYIDSRECLVQYEKNDVTLVEHKIPCLYNDNSCSVSLKITEKLYEKMKDSKWMIIDDGWCEMDGYSFLYEPGDFMTWGTELPELACLCGVPDVSLSGMYSISVEKNKLCFTSSDNSEKYFFETIKNFLKPEEQKKVYVDMDNLSGILGEYRGLIMKLYLREDFPICIEFNDNTRIYIAPLILDAVSD